MRDVEDATVPKIDPAARPHGEEAPIADGPLSKDRPAMPPVGQRPGVADRPYLGPFTRRRLSALAVVSLVVVVMLVVVTRPLTGSASIPSLTNAPGATFYRIGEQTQGLNIGDRAPDLAAADGSNALTDVNGQPITLAGFRGRPVWLLFWATWCPPCQTETPDIQRTWEGFQAAGLAVVAVDVQEPAEIVADYVRTYGSTYGVALDPTASTLKSYAIFGLPTHYFIDRDGIIRDRWFGPLNGLQMRQKIAPLMGPG